MKEAYIQKVESLDNVRYEIMDTQLIHPNVIADLDGEGEPELIVGTGTTDYKVKYRVYTWDGSKVKYIGYFRNYKYLYSGFSDLGGDYHGVLFSERDQAFSDRFDIITVEDGRIVKKQVKYKGRSGVISHGSTFYKLLNKNMMRNLVK